MHEAIHEGWVSLGPDRHPFSGTGTGDGQMWFDLHPFGTANPGVGMTGNAHDSMGGLRITTERKNVIRCRCVGSNRKAAVP